MSLSLKFAAPVAMVCAMTIPGSLVGLGASIADGASSSFAAVSHAVIAIASSFTEPESDKPVARKLTPMELSPAAARALETNPTHFMAGFELGLTAGYQAIKGRPSVPLARDVSPDVGMGYDTGRKCVIEHARVLARAGRGFSEAQLVQINAIRAHAQCRLWSQGLSGIKVIVTPL